jgi:hypothetical protein
VKLWQVRTSEIELSPKKNAIVAHPDYKNSTFCPKKCHYGKSWLRNWTFPPQKCNYQLWHVHTSEI